MIKIFIFGSRSINDISKYYYIIDNCINNNCQILVGDCNGVDKLVQDYLISKKYYNVIVYSTNNPRNYNNNFKLNIIKSNNRIDRKYYELKDNEMINDCSIAFCIYDGKSIGSKNNITKLKNLNKYIIIKEI